MPRKRSPKSSRNSVTHTGILVYQREPPALPIFLFSSTPDTIFQWARIEQTAQKKGAAQRVLSPNHKRTIESYIEASPQNIIPTAVTLALPPKSFNLQEFNVDGLELPEATSFATVTIDNNDKPGLVLDGQHRLEALRDQPIPLICSLILGANQVEQSLHFIIINNKAKKVPQDLVKAILRDMPPAAKKELDDRIQSARLSLGNYGSALKLLDSKRTSPFKGFIDWDANRRGPRLFKPLALEGALKEIMVHLVTAENLDLDECLEIMVAMWNGIKSAVEEAYQQPWGKTDLKLYSKAGLVAVTEFVVSRLNLNAENGVDVTDPDYVHDQAAKIISEIPVSFWLLPWRRKSLDTSAGRETIRDAMRRVRVARHHSELDPLQSVGDFLQLDGTQSPEEEDED